MQPKKQLIIISIAGLIILAVLSIAFILISSNSSDSYSSEYSTKTDSNLNLGQSEEIKFSFDYPKDWEVNNSGFERRVEDDSQYSIKAYVVILDKDMNQNILDLFEKVPEDSEYKSESLGDKSFIVHEYTSIPEDDDISTVTDIYWNSEEKDTLFRFTCYGPEEDKGLINEVCDRFVESFEID